MERISYPRTPHLPWSPGVSRDDVRVADLGAWAGGEVVVTEKLDGENTTLYRDGSHARSLDSGHHPSRSWVKALQGRVGGFIPVGWRVCGENLYARHSLAYQELDGYFYGFSVWDGDECLDWDSTVGFLRGLGIPVPTVLWRGVFDEKMLRRLKVDTLVSEGYVVRPAAGFGLGDFGRTVAKWVRPAHVRTSTHWMSAPVVPNGLGPGARYWDIRSGAGFELPDGDQAAAEKVADELRPGEGRLVGVLAAAYHRRPRGRVVLDLVDRVGMGTARRVGDVVGLHRLLHHDFPEDQRRSGLLRFATAVDLGVLHAVAGAVATGGARDQVAWSALHAEDLPRWPEFAGSARRLAEARDLVIRDGRAFGPEEADAATWRWRDRDCPEFFHLVGISGSGKSTFAAKSDVDEVVSMDDLRADAGDRADQRSNARVLGVALDRLGAALRHGRSALWDATSITARQRDAVQAVARRHDATRTYVVVLASEAEIRRRNANRADPVPDHVLSAQIRRFDPPYAWQAHRIRYVDATGTVVADAHQ
ncbi:hypothetical protein GCM10022243_43310 [Saccharothrix violaceirubra]|uniref:Putative kinase n=1 Tax=Saccharothrix violaceirubra TaxID=413306 RepID=A0A7W7T306_9PSEU|nr:RNA ligase family protein [Saccharothrix violaceirubra]MBB4965619.1 putative kinase [Saccharothrix violaceirubra]